MHHSHTHNAWWSDTHITATQAVTTKTLGHTLAALIVAATVAAPRVVSIEMSVVALMLYVGSGAVV